MKEANSSILKHDENLKPSEQETKFESENNTNKMKEKLQIISEQETKFENESTINKMKEKLHMISKTQVAQLQQLQQVKKELLDMRRKQQQRNRAVHNIISPYASFHQPMFGPPPIYPLFKPVQKPVDRRVQMLRSGIKLKFKSSKVPVGRCGLFLRPVRIAPPPMPYYYAYDYFYVPQVQPVIRRSKVDEPFNPFYAPEGAKTAKPAPQAKPPSVADPRVPFVNTHKVKSSIKRSQESDDSFFYAPEGARVGSY